ncbi:hypothetical protein [Actinoplanes siamensis]|uniref:Uncharacterized protein n=1 Tax=Actinoplanes siamensis TaxID=1223317 RepID=A0A919NEG9_9ACTN|nr:hypothetical protein [Actinoplanes siamensis]GIF09777.1 hypothetical protein Asi03nite_73150 [Actinoplanes siamensis]
MTGNPLVARSTDSTTGYTGLGLIEDAADITNGIRNHSWIDPTLGSLGAGLDTLSVTIDPLGTLASWGAAWLMEHVEPLRQPLDRLAGNADQIAAHATTWANVAAFTEQAHQQYTDRLHTEVNDWFGASGDAYHRHADAHLHVMATLSTAAHGISYAVEGAGLLVALVRGIVRDLIAEFIGTLAARLPQWLAEEGLTLGLATPAVAGQVATLVATWVNKIQHFIRALLDSLRRLHPKLDQLADIFTRLRTQTHTLARTNPTNPATSEFRPDFPRGADFIDNGDGISERAAQAYRRIRNSPQDTPTVAANTGIDPRIIEGMRQNLFVQQHDVPLGPNRVERGYFTPEETIADLWDSAAQGTLSPARVAEFRNLAAHEYVENKLMEAGLPYRSAHPAAFDADGDRIVHRDHPGAHDLAPHQYKPRAPLEHWRMFDLDGSGLRFADDLSNLDEVVDAALRGLRR